MSKCASDFDDRLADFGLSAFWRRDRAGKKADLDPNAHPGMGFSIPWAAPEFFTQSCSPTFATDVFAFGVVLWEVATCLHPYAGADDVMALPMRVVDGLRPDMNAVEARLAAVTRDGASPTAAGTGGADPPDGDIAALIAACLRRDPAQRPTMRRVLAGLKAAQRRAERRQQLDPGLGDDGAHRARTQLLYASGQVRTRKCVWGLGSLTIGHSSSSTRRRCCARWR